MALSAGLDPRFARLKDVGEEGAVFRSRKDLSEMLFVRRLGELLARDREPPVLEISDRAVELEIRRRESRLSLGPTCMKGEVRLGSLADVFYKSTWLFR